jgi:hypothetical protein
MTCNPTTCFHGVSSWGATLLNTELENNLKCFLDWAFLGIGAWSNVQIPTTGMYGGSWHQLIPVNDPAYTDGTVWQSARKDWVYETGICYSGGSPTVVNGVYINNVYKGTGDATFAHTYNFPDGRVIFNNPVASSVSVSLNYSYRNVQVYIADQAQWWTELQYNSLRVDSNHFSAAVSGDWSILSNHRVQLPAVVIETVPRRKSSGYELGASSLQVKQDVLFHILAETRWERNQLLDIFSLQNDKDIWLFDSDQITIDGTFPLDYRGMLVSGGRMYSDLIEIYKWQKCTFTNTQIVEVKTYNPTIYEGAVRTTCDIIIGIL